VTIASGWDPSVGVVGWSLGGGHGPFAPSLGLGVDNLLAAELVDANGQLLMVNATSQADLFWALRGGGGSTWGVVTAVLLKGHLVHPAGYTQTGLEERLSRVEHDFNSAGQLLQKLTQP